MRCFFLFLSLLYSAISFAFNSLDSALDFVYEYSSDTIWGSKLPEGVTYRVGVIERDIDVVINERYTESDTFSVPQNHYVFFVTTPENVGFEGESPLVSYLFLSKEDSSYVVIDTVGNPEYYMKWDIVRTNGRVLANQAVSDLSSRISYYIQTENSIYDVYLIEDTTNLYLVDCAEYLREDIDLRNAWTFIIDTHDGSCLSVNYFRDRIENVMIFSMIATPFGTMTDFSSIDGFKLVLSNPNGVRKIKSKLDITLSPNPVSDEVCVNIDNCSLTLLSLDGKILKEVNDNKVSIGEFQSGLYLLKIDEKDRSTIKEIIKE